MVSLAQAWQTGRTDRANRPARTPILAKAVRAAVRTAGRTLPTWRRLRTATLQVTAFGFLDYAAFQWHTIAGCVAVGASLLILEALGGAGTPGGDRR